MFSTVSTHRCLKLGYVRNMSAHGCRRNETTLRIILQGLASRSHACVVLSSPDRSRGSSTVENAVEVRRDNFVIM